MSGHSEVRGAVLAGGRSRRMGVPKEGTLLPDGRPMIAAVLQALEGAFGRAVVVGVCAGFDCRSRRGLLHIPDLQPDLGPLAGLEALLASGLAAGYIVAACDQPFLTAALVRKLAPSTGGGGRYFRSARLGERLAPFPGYFPAAWLHPVREALEAGHRSLCRFIQGRDDVEWILLDESEGARLASVNTPQDLSHFFGDGTGRHA